MNNYKLRRSVAMGVSLVAVLGIVAGCTSNGSESEPSASSKTSEPAKPITLTYWAPLNPVIGAVVSDLGQIDMYKEMEKRTQIKMQFKHPAANQVDEQFKLMIASHDLPDVIETNWLTYPGSPTKAIQDGVIIKLNDLIDKYAPNLKKIMDENPEIKKQMRTDNGDIFSFPFLTVTKSRVFSGPVIRKDWLDELGLSMPETMDDWEKTLRAFKEKKGAKAPYTFNYGQLGVVYGFLEAFGITNDFYVDNGKIKYGPAEPAYKDFIATFSRWYKEGLIDPDFATNDSKMLDANITGDKSGAILGFVGGSIGRYIDAMKSKEPNVNLVAAQYPVLKKGDEPKFIRREWDYGTSGGAAAITTANKNPIETVKYLDYFYGKEGHLLSTFGIEGQTYKMENGLPTYTDLIMKNPDKLPVASALAKYTRATAPAPGYSDDRYQEQYYAYPQQKEALNLWAKYSNNALKVLIPPISNSPDEATELSKIANDLKTYTTEMTTKFIMGGESLDQYDKFVGQLKKLNVDRAIELKQAALDRYNKRQ
ncbi:extracellular solute-binding protein [Paenibacillus oryzisoli]|uniref:extracellular solute-binding protein n=1 Tax=Paenibacillus oryzisoli TaxID=1850517 RepID=UPI003D2CD293